MSDEAHFHLSSYVNKQNCKYLNVKEQNLFMKSHFTWRIIGSHFLYYQNWETATVTGAANRKSIEKYIKPKIQNWNVWLQRDCPTAHNRTDIHSILRDNFFQIDWFHVLVIFLGLLRSCDLTTLDFYGRYLNSYVYINGPRTLKHLKDNTSQEIRNIPPEMLRKVMDFVS